MKKALLILWALGALACKQHKQGGGQDMPAAAESLTARDILAALEIVAATQGVLGRNLMGKIQEGGTLAALSFCNEQAYPLTDSMATASRVAIKRVSDKPRNPGNQASKREQELIESYANDLARGHKLKPVFEKENGSLHFYSPIVTSKACLQCHGNPGAQIAPEVLKNLQELYPRDQATGYGANQIRGMWRVTERTTP